MSPLTYPEVGATRVGPLPAGYRHLRYRTMLGHGRGTMSVAAEAILTWRMHEAVGIRIYASAPRAEPGVTVTCGLGLGRLRLTAPCQVVWTVADERRVGFGYGTLHGHPFRGEEAFVVERADDERVWLAITSFSLPAQWYMRAAGPAASLLQRAFARRCGQALKKLRA